MDDQAVRQILSRRREGFCLPQEFYTKDYVYEFDIKAVFARNWIFAAFDAELPDPGNYLAMDVGPTPIVLVRTDSGDVRGFFNSCRHRGAQVTENGTGKCRRLVCPYHQWSYTLDGRLAGAPGMDRTFDKSAFGLVPIQVESVGGTIYVCLSEDAPDFAPFREAFGPLIGRYNLKDGKVIHRQTIVENANWKLAMENARECAHCAVGHPELCMSLVDVTTFDYEGPSDPHAVQFMEGLRRRGIPGEPIENEWFSTGHVPLKAGVKAMSMDGEFSSRKFLGEDLEDLGYLRWALQAHCYNVALPDYVFTFSAIPAGPQKTIIHSKWLVHKDAVEGVDYDVDSLVSLWATTNGQDVSLTENNQRGVNSIGYRPGPYQPKQEEWCRRFTDWYCLQAREYLDAPSFRQAAE